MIAAWIWTAVLGHLLNAVAFIIDKTLLTSAFKNSSTYAALIGLLSGVVILATPWVPEWPGLDHMFAIALFGGTQVLALWAFFEALSKGEASRVVPIAGVLVALLTLAGTRLTIGETFSTERLIGFGVLVVATGILAWGGKTRDRLTMPALAYAVLAAALFAISTVSGKVAFEYESFLGVFVFSRYFSLFAAMMLIALYRPARNELSRLFKPGDSPEAMPASAVMLTIGAQLSGAVGFILINYAIALGSAPLVSSLQSVQYGFIVLVAWLGGENLRALLKEHRTPLVVCLKSTAIVLVGIGLYLISRF